MALTWDPGKLIATFGPIPLIGFAEEMIVIEKLGPGDRLKIGAAGEAARIKSRDRSYKVTAKFLDTAIINDALSLVFSANNLSGLLEITDIERPRGFGCPDAFLEAVPGVTYSNDVAVREWVWLCPVGSFVP